jgi:hypothetical protein
MSFDDGEFLTDKSQSGHTFTNAGGAQNVDGKFGRSFDPHAGYAYTPHSDDFYFTGEFCIELWLMYEVYNQTGGIISKYTAATGDRGWAFLCYTGGLRWYVSTDGLTATTLLSKVIGKPDQDIWYHYCLERDSSNLVRSYANGVMVDSAEIPGALNYNDSIPLKVGAYSTDTSTSNASFANIDELRITKGVARYGTDLGFAPPTGPFPNS